MFTPFRVCIFSSFLVFIFFSSFTSVFPHHFHFSLRFRNFSFLFFSPFTYRPFKSFNSSCPLSFFCAYFFLSEIFISFSRLHIIDSLYFLALYFNNISSILHLLSRSYNTYLFFFKFFVFLSSNPCSSCSILFLLFSSLFFYFKISLYPSRSKLRKHDAFFVT